MLYTCSYRCGTYIHAYTSRCTRIYKCTHSNIYLLVLSLYCVILVLCYPCVICIVLHVLIAYPLWQLMLVLNRAYIWLYYFHVHPFLDTMYTCVASGRRHVFIICHESPKTHRYPLYRRLGGPQGRSGQVRNISSPPGFDPRTVQPVAQSLHRLTDPHTGSCLTSWGRISSSKRTLNHGLGDILAYVIVDLKKVTTYVCSCMILSLHCWLIYDQVSSPLSLFFFLFPDLSFQMHVFRL